MDPEICVGSPQGFISGQDCERSDVAHKANRSGHEPGELQFSPQYDFPRIRTLTSSWKVLRQNSFRILLLMIIHLRSFRTPGSP